MQGEFTQRDLYKLDLSKTTIANMRGHQLTLPSSLVCRQPWSSVTPDPQYSVLGEPFEAIKYLSVFKSSEQLFAVIEISWHSLS